MTIAPVQPQQVPLIFGKQDLISMDWWRWLRDLGVAAGTADSLSALAAIANGTLLTEQSLVVGNNTIAHGLSGTPSGWFATRLEGAFASSGGGGASFYPNISTPKLSYDDGAGSRSTDTLTLSSTPADGSTLILVWSALNTTPVTSTVTQTGVTWAKVDGISSTDQLEIWIGHTIASAGTAVNVNYTGSHSVETALSVMEIPEISATAARDSVAVALSSRVQVVSDAGYSYSGWTPPQASAGDIMITAVQSGADTSTTPGPNNGWELNAYSRDNLNDATHVALTKVAQEDGPAVFRSMSNVSSTRRVVQATFASSLSAFSFQSITIPHGLRQVSVDGTNLVLSSVSAVEADLWVFL